MKVKINYVSRLEKEIEELGMTEKQARVLGAVVRGVIGDILNDRTGDTIRFATNGQVYKLALEKE